MSDIRQLIRTFFEGRFSENTQRIFGRWLLFTAADDEKAQAMEELWNERTDRADTRTMDDLQRLREGITVSDGTARRSHRVHLWRRAAAAAVLMLLVSGVTYVATRHFSAPRVEQETLVQVSVPYGETRSVVLNDSTHVVLNAGSTLIYPKQFKADTRQVYLTGQANFDVHADAEHPFIVKTQCIDVQVLGTRFGVEAYADHDVVRTILQKGSVRVAVNDSTRQSGNSSYILTPDQCLEYAKSSGRVNIIDPVDAERLLRWGTGYLTFTKASFTDIIAVLERRFDVNIVCGSIDKMNGSYYVKFHPDETLDDIFAVLGELSTPFKYRRNGHTIYIQPQQ